VDHPGVAGPKTGTAPALVKQGRARDSELMILTPVSRYYYIDYNRPGRRSKFYYGPPNLRCTVLLQDRRIVVNCLRLRVRLIAAQHGQGASRCLSDRPSRTWRARPGR
jgi:hypothetical protein